MKYRQLLFSVLLDVKHRIPQIRMNQHVFRPCLWMSSIAQYTLRWSSRGRDSIKKPTEIASGPFTHNICIVSGRADANSFGGATEKIAYAVCQIFEHVRDVLEGRWNFALGEDFVEHDVVVGGAGGALERGVGLQEEVPVAGLGDAAVDYGAVLGIGGAVGVAGSRGIEPGVVALADYDDGDVRETLLRVRRRI